MIFYSKLIIGTMALISAVSFANNRQLLIFGKEQQQVLVKQQMNLLAQVKPGIEERDIKIILVDNKSILYHKYKVQKGVFTLILLGKDNLQKLRSNQVVLPAQLFELIDAMPMRKQEMKKE